MSRDKQIPRIRVGPAGWAYKDWHGIVYPRPKPPGFHEAEFLAHYFDTIELNVTFYRPVTPATARGWMRLEREVRPAMEALRDAGKLGALLAQFPWSFKKTPESFDYLGALIARFSDFPLVVEVRHSSWDLPDVYAWLAERSVGFCNIDQPVIGRSLKPGERLTAPVGYVRLHGRNYTEWFRENAEGEGSEQRYNYLYPPEELDPWAKRIERIAAHAKETFVVTNNHYLGKGAVNALELIHMLTKKPVAAPPSLVEHYPILASITTTREVTPTLFPTHDWKEPQV